MRRILAMKKKKAKVGFDGIESGLCVAEYWQV